MARTLGVAGSAAVSAARAPVTSVLMAIGGCSLLGWGLYGCAVQRGAAPGNPAYRAYQGLHLLRRELLPVAGACGSRDVLVHQGASQVVGTRLECQLRSLDTHLDPGDLDVPDRTVQTDPGYGVNLQGFLERGAATGLALQIDRSRHMHEGQGDELEQPAVVIGDLLVEISDDHQV